MNRRNAKAVRELAKIIQWRFIIFKKFSGYRRKHKPYKKELEHKNIVGITVDDGKQLPKLHNSEL